MSTLIATPQEQRALLEVQELDAQIARAKTRLASLRGDEEYAAAQAEAKHLAAQLAEAEQGREDADRDALAAADTASATRARRDRTRSRLQEGQVSPKDLEGLVHEEATLEALLEQHDAAALAAMQAADAATAAVAETTQRLEPARRTVSDRAEHLRAEGAEVTKVGRRLAAERAQTAAGVPQPVLARYEKIRDRNAGLGVGTLTGSHSGPAGTDLSPVELERLRALPENVLAECPVTGVLLVRL